MTTRRTTAAAIALVAATAFTVASCVPTTTPTASPSTAMAVRTAAPAPSTPTTTATPPAPSPTPGRAPVAADLVVVPGGLQAPGAVPLRVGVRLAPDSSPSPLAVWDAAACEGTQAPGRWVAPFPDTPFAPYLLWTDAASGELTRIDITAAGPHLAEGIAIDSSLGQLTGARPDVVSVGISTSGSELWRIHDPGGEVVIEVATGDEYSGRPVGTILAMSVLAAGDPQGFLAGLPFSWYSTFEGDICG